MELPPNELRDNDEPERQEERNIVSLDAFRRSRVAKAVGDLSMRSKYPKVDDDIMAGHPAYETKLRREAAKNATESGASDPDDTPPDQPA